MTSINKNNLFRSQRITMHRSTPPVLLPPKSLVGHNDNGQYRDNKQEKESLDEATAWQWKIEVDLIPSLNMYYILEPTSITLKQTPVSVVQSRMADFLRCSSISYEYDAAYVRLNCVTSNMLKFVVQFWRVGGGPHNTYLEDPNDALTVELQRRQGSVLELQSIRRKMFKELLTGEQIIADSQKPRPSLPGTIMAEVDLGYNHEEGLVDAIEIALRLLESQCVDQSRLGLESLGMLTNAAIVSARDALVVSKAIVFQEGRFGARLQASLSRFFGLARQLDNAEDEDAMGHSMALALLMDALQLVVEDAARDNQSINILHDNSFWKRVSEDLSNNVERAIQNPNEAAKSVKCIRLIKSLEGKTVGAAVAHSLAWRSCLVQAHRYGKHCHLSLERESQKLLVLDTENFVRSF